MIYNSFSSGITPSISTITDKQFKVADSSPFEDTVSCLTWSQDENPNLLLCSTWDGYVIIYKVISTDAEVSTVDRITLCDTTRFENPVLSVAWQNNLKRIIAGSIDGSIFIRDPGGFAVGNLKIGQHDDAVKGVYSVEEINAHVICSVSYDKTMKFWDIRSRGQISSFDLGAKAVCSDFLFPYVAIGLSNEKLLMFDIRYDIHDFRGDDRSYIDSPLGSNSSLSAISISKESIVGIASCDGRSNLSKFERRNDGTIGLNNIVTFKAHKIDPGQNGNTSNLKILYPIHAVGLHPLNRDTYFTAGGDGCVNFWDIPARNKLSFSLVQILRSLQLNIALMENSWRMLMVMIGLRVLKDL